MVRIIVSAVVMNREAWLVGREDSGPMILPRPCNCNGLCAAFWQGWGCRGDGQKVPRPVLFVTVRATWKPGYFRLGESQ